MRHGSRSGPEDADGGRRRGGASAQGVRQRARRRRHLPGGGAGRDLRPARPQRRRQDHHGGVRGGAAAPGPGPHPGAGSGSRAGHPRAAPPHRMPASAGGAPRSDQGLGGPGPLCLARPRKGGLERGPGSVGAAGPAGRRLLQPLGRGAAAALRGPGADQPARGGLPRRADPGARPRRPPGRLGPGPGGPGSGRHRGPGDPLHGGGAAALRPHRRGPSGAGGGRGQPPGADQPPRWRRPGGLLGRSRRRSQLAVRHPPRPRGDAAMGPAWR